MDSISWATALAVLGVLVPVVAALWEFVFLGFKRLGYRVQMDTEAREALPELDQPSLVLPRIDGQRAELRAADREAYPFWETEYAYTYREPEPHSLVAGFLRYLTDEVGQDIIRRHGHRPCAEPRNPVLCRPEE